MTSLSPSNWPYAGEPLCISPLPMCNYHWHLKPYALKSPMWLINIMATCIGTILCNVQSSPQFKYNRTWVKESAGRCYYCSVKYLYIRTSQVHTRHTDLVDFIGAVTSWFQLWSQRKDSSLCFCIDYRRLNAVTKKDAYALPCIEECRHTAQRLLILPCNGLDKWVLASCHESYWPREAPIRGWMNRMSCPLACAMRHSIDWWSLCWLIFIYIYWQPCLVCLDNIVAFGEVFSTVWVNLRTILVWMVTRCPCKVEAQKVWIILQHHQVPGSPGQLWWHQAFQREGRLPS